MPSLHELRRSKVLHLCIALANILCFAGIIWGWPFLLAPMKSQGVFSYLCENATTPVVSDFGAPIVWGLDPSPTTAMVESGGGSGGGSANSTVGCIEQNLRFNLVFNVGSSVNTLSSFLCGIVLDRFGPRVPIIYSGFAVPSGLALFSVAFAFYQNEVIVNGALIIGMALLSSGGMFYFLTSFQISALFPARRVGLVIAVMSGTFDSATVTFLIFQALAPYVDLYVIFCAWTALSVVLFTVTVVFTPKHFIDDSKKQPGDIELEDIDNTDQSKRPSDNEPPSEEGTSNLHNDTTNNRGSTTTESAALSREVERINNDIEASAAAEDDAAVVVDSTEAIVSVNKDPYGLNSASFWNAVKAPEFIIFTVYMSLQMLRMFFYFGSVDAYLLRLNEVTGQTYITLFGFVLLFGVLPSPIIGWALDKYGVVAAFIAVTAIGCVFNITTCIEIIELQVVSFIAFATFRAFIYGSSASYVAIVFGFSTFGKLTGLLMLCSSVASLLQYPIYSLINLTLDGDFFIVNVVFAVLSVVVFIFPAFLYWRKRRIGKSVPLRE